jgi:poly(hydroxyalkanoate) granule-associated protein
MNTIAMENAPEVSLAATQTASEPAGGAIRQVWWVSLGLLAVAGEQTGRILDVLIRRGKEFEPSMYQGLKKAGKEVSEAVGTFGTHLKRTGQKVGKAPEKAESLVDQGLSAVSQRMGVPSKDEIRTLNQKVDELSAKVEQLLTKVGVTTPQPVE